MKLIKLFMVIPLVLLVYQCSDRGNPVQSDPPLELISYTSEIQPIFDNNCIFCHGPDYYNAGLQLDSYPQVMSGTSDNGPVILPGNSSESLIVQKLQGVAAVGDSLMPQGGPPLSAEDIQAIIQWIDQGALNTQ